MRFRNRSAERLGERALPDDAPDGGRPSLGKVRQSWGAGRPPDEASEAEAAVARPAAQAPASDTSRRVTMTDVARIAGVSQSSVSLVLNQMTGARISEATRQRVIEAAREIGYELPSARRMTSGTVERNAIA